MVELMPRNIHGPGIAAVAAVALLLVVAVGGLLGWSLAGIFCGAARLLIR
jgi:hypothetical protein